MAEERGEDLLPLRARKLLRELGLSPRKALGQHFLIDRGVLAAILKAAELAPQDLVVEVGPGLGVLTRELARRAGRVVAVEVDRELASALASAFASSPRVSILQADILTLEVAALVGEPPPQEYKVVANLPYYLATPILRHFLAAPLRPRLLVVMVQKEVAQAMAARPGRMSYLSVLIQLQARPRIVRYVSPRSFYPSPQVHSAVVRLEVHPQPLVAGEPGPFLELVRAGFAAPRKQLHNSLALGLGMEPQAAARALEQAGLDPRRRPQSLSLEEWARLAQAISSPLPGVKRQSS